MRELSRRRGRWGRGRLSGAGPSSRHKRSSPGGLRHTGHTAAAVRTGAPWGRGTLWRLSSRARAGRPPPHALSCVQMTVNMFYVYQGLEAPQFSKAAVYGLYAGWLIRAGWPTPWATWPTYF